MSGSIHRPSERSPVSAAGAAPDLEYLTPPESFSRVENAKKNLEALSIRLRFDIQNEISANLREGLPVHASALDSAIRAAEDGMREFEGTEEALYIAQDLLFALKKAGRFDRWIEVFLTALYQHPTHPVVARFATQAVTLSTQIEQQDRVMAGLQHLVDLPLNFEGKEKVKASLQSLKSARESRGSSREDQFSIGRPSS